MNVKTDERIFIFGWILTYICLLTESLWLTSYTWTGWHIVTEGKAHPGTVQMKCNSSWFIHVTHDETRPEPSVMNEFVFVSVPWVQSRYRRAEVETSGTSWPKTTQMTNRILAHGANELQDTIPAFCVPHLITKTTVAAEWLYDDIKHDNDVHLTCRRHYFSQYKPNVFQKHVKRNSRRLHASWSGHMTLRGAFDWLRASALCAPPLTFRK